MKKPAASRSAALALLLATAGGCTPAPVVEDPDRLDLDPNTIFVSQVRDDLIQTCATSGSCHAQEMGPLKPFLVPGDEYSSITRYRGGAFLTDPPKDSELLNKGRHAGPALEAALAERLLIWLDVQVRTGEGKSLSTPSVALRYGDFFLSLERLVGDPQARITFTIGELKTDNTYLLQDLTLSSGPETGVHLAHPKLLLITDEGVRPDPSDALASVDLVVPRGQDQRIGSGGQILTRVRRGARLALAFVTIERTDARPAVPPQCAALGLFNSGVRPTLASPCASMCHGGNLPAAKSAFDMSSAASSDAEAQRRLCVQALSRVNLQTPGRSVLVLQATPAALGGTPNHPYKLPDATALRDAVSAWAAAEKR